MLIDTHCHMYSSEVENAEEIIKKALKNNIIMILNGTDLLSNIEALKLADKYENVYVALGYLYSSADSISEDDILLLDKQLNHEKVVAVGEIGLDYYHSKENKDNQIKLFEKMLNLAEKHDLPVIIHSRKATQDTFNTLKKYDLSGSLHSYAGSVEMASEFIKLGLYIGISGTVTHKNNKKTKNLVRKIDINHILVETDSPYLTPEEKRGEINTSLNLKYIIHKIAQEKNMSDEEIIKITTKNAKNLFNL